MLVNFLNIKYFLAIVEEGSISAASRKLYISQQALSEQLKKMELETGVPLIKRGKKFKLTEAGECLYRDGRELLRIYNNMMEDIHDATNSRRRKITLGIPTFWVPSYMTDLLTRFRAKHPEYELAVVKRQHSDIEHNMDGVDLYLTPLPLCPYLENHIVMEHDPFYVTFHEDLARQVFGSRWGDVESQLIGTQDLSLLAEMPFIALRDRYGQLMQSLTMIFQEYHIEPEFGFSSDTFYLNEHACINQLGCLLSTKSHIQMFRKKRSFAQTEHLLSYPIKVSSIDTKLAISHRKGLHLHPAEIQFIQEAADLLAELD